MIADHPLSILGPGPIAPMTRDDRQFVEFRRITIEDACRMFGIPVDRYRAIARRMGWEDDPANTEEDAQ